MRGQGGRKVVGEERVPKAIMARGSHVGVSESEDNPEGKDLVKWKSE